MNKAARRRRRRIKMHEAERKEPERQMQTKAKLIFSKFLLSFISVYRESRKILLFVLYTLIS